MLSPTPILTARSMRAAELAAVARGVPLSALMDAAGRALAQIIWRASGGRPVHLLAGRGNNGGDGYVAAHYLTKQGARVTLSAAGDPATDLCIAARNKWAGPVGTLADAPVDNAVMVDCLFGTGLNRPITADIAGPLSVHAAAATRRIAADIPSGLDCDSGVTLGCPYRADVTVAFACIKPAHVLFPGAAHCGTVLVADIGLLAEDIAVAVAEGTGQAMHVAAMPPLTSPDYDSHKYRRGLVAVVAGTMPGAAELAVRGALRSGAGYVQLIGGKLPAAPPFAAVRRPWRDGAALDDPRIDAVVIGPGLGGDDDVRNRLSHAVGTGKPLVLDADALSLLPDGPLDVPAILTPHSGEFAKMCDADGSKIERARVCAAQRNAVVLHKGADTVIAAPDGRVAIHSPGSPWLSVAGTGDVLAGICGAMLARGLAPFEAAQAAVLLHQRAAGRCGPGLIADDLVAGPLWP